MVMVLLETFPFPRIGKAVPRGPFSVSEEFDQIESENEIPGSGIVPPPVTIPPGEYILRIWAEAGIAASQIQHANTNSIQVCQRIGRIRGDRKHMLVV